MRHITLRNTSRLVFPITTLHFCIQSLNYFECLIDIDNPLQNWGFQVFINDKALLSVGKHKGTKTELKAIDCFKIDAGHRTTRIRIEQTGKFTAKAKVILTFFNPLDFSSQLPTHKHLNKYNGLSQYRLSQKVGHRICGPTSLAISTKHPAPLEFATICYSKEHDLFGVWLQNTYAVNTLYRSAFATYLFSINELCTLLLKGASIIVSISFTANKLPNSPISTTKGHLVLAAGFCKSGIYVHDPASPNPQKTLRLYPWHSFISSWSSKMAYILNK